MYPELKLLGLRLVAPAVGLAEALPVLKDTTDGPRGRMKSRHVAAHPQVYDPMRQGVRALRARRSRDSLPLSLSLREQMQEGCTFPITPKRPSQARRLPHLDPRVRSLGRRRFALWWYHDSPLLVKADRRALRWHSSCIY